MQFCNAITYVLTQDILNHGIYKPINKAYQIWFQFNVCAIGISQSTY